MTVTELYSILDRLYPAALSCSWDNDGIMCLPDSTAEIRSVLVALDATRGAVREAVSGGFDLLLTHHPMVFHGLKSVSAASPLQERLIDCIRGGTAVISLHTRLDAGEGGVNDCLASALELTDTASFGDTESPTLGRIGTTSCATVDQLVMKIKRSLAVQAPRLYFAADKPGRVAVVGGSGGSFIEAAASSGAGTLVTGECDYNDALDAMQYGINIIECGHYETEFPVCRRLAQLALEYTGAEAVIYDADKPKLVL